MCLALKIFAGVGVIPFLPFLVVTIWNNGRMTRLESDFSKVAHPAATRKILSWSEIGNFGNGDHLDFFVAEVRQKTAPTQLGTFYRGATVPVPYGADEDFQNIKNGRQPLEIEVLPSPLPARFVFKRNSWLEKDLSALAGTRDLYVLSVRNSGENNDISAIFDVRAW